jgi:inositol phosphorylceramide synthase catalytic subunit
MSVGPRGLSAIPQAMPARPRWHDDAGTFLLYALPFAVVAGGYAVLGRFSGFRPAHVEDIQALERRLFAVQVGAEKRVLSELIAERSSLVLDLLCAATYFLFLVEVFGLAIYLFFRSRRRMLELSLGFLAVNLIGWTIWVLYPVAPPWYADLYVGGGAPALHAAGDPAALERVDAWLGIRYFQAFYAKSAYVFGALPSLHVAYAVLVAQVTWPLGGWLRVATLAFAGIIAFAAVYLRHHYILDVIAGALLGLFVGTLLALSPVREGRR